MATKKMAIAPAEIRRFRETLDWTQAQIADFIGVTSEAVSQWETGAKCPSGPSKKMLLALARKKKVDLRVDDDD